MKKFLALLLACLMLLPMVGCDKESKTEETSVTEPGSGGDDKTEEVEQKPPLTKITVEIFDRGTDSGRTDPTNNYWTDWIKQKVLEDENIEVEFIPVSRWEEETQLTNLMGSGSAPDLCFTYSNSLIALFRDQGGLTNLVPYMDLMKDLDELLGEDSALPGRRLIERNKVMETGEIFAIPARRMNVARINTFIRKDWLDKLGLPIPKTRDEWYEALVAFRDNADKLGTKVIPFIMTDDTEWRTNNLLASFLNPDMSPRDMWVNSVIDRWYLLDGCKEGYRFVNKMYNDGLIDPEFYLYRDDVKQQELIEAGRVGSFIHNWDQAFRQSPSYLDNLKENVPDAEIIAIDPFVNSKGKTFKRIYDAAGLHIFVPSFSKVPEAAVRYLNWLAKPDVYQFLQFGEEGKNHKLVNGIPAAIEAKGETIQNSANNIDYTIPMNGIWLGDDETTSKALANGYTCDPQLIVDAYKYSMKDGEPTMVVPVTLSAAGPYTEDLRLKGNEGTCRAIMAPVDQFDKVWDEFIADWLASGAQEIIDERAAKYFDPTK
jgi:putative aldouronate transport system substrate-binding protein